jgi:putative DNA primase/helicase
MAESDSAGRLDESAIKQFTGGEEIKARELYQAAFTFKPQFSLWLSCNDLPAVRDKSLFASDRIRVIEFNRHFSDEEQDKGLKDYFESEEAMAGIFTWLVEGYRKYLKRGLRMPESMQEVVTQYEKDNDFILQFLEERCEKGGTEEMKLKTIYDHYKIWSRTCGFATTSLKKFNAGLAQHPEWYESTRQEKGIRWYKGIRIKG